MPRSKLGETVACARLGSGAAWFGSDILANMPTLPSSFVPRQLFKWTGSAPGFRIFKFALFFMVKDREGALRMLRERMEADPPTVIVPGHGDVLAREGLAAEARALLDAAI